MKRIAISCLLALAVLAACVPRVAFYSPAAYDTAVALKVDTRMLVLLATEPYPRHQDETAALLRRMEKAYEYARGIPDNELTAWQWEILKDPDRDLAGGFFKMWKENGALGEAFVLEKSKQIDRAFDQIIGLESRKIKQPAGQ